MDAALGLFQERGYYGTSMRDIGARSGTSVSHLYYYFPSKASVLRALMTGIVRDLLAALAEASSQPDDTPTARLSALVQATVLFHTKRQAEAFVGRSELRSLEGDDRTEVVGLYHQVTTLFDGVIAEGIKRGEFRCAWRAEAVRAIITMCTSVSTWYRAEGSLSPQAIARRYVALSLAMLGASPDA